MENAGVSRRNFLKMGTMTAAAAVAVTVTGGALGTNAWAMSISNLDQHTADTLVVLSRILYPHDNLGDMYYAASIEALDGKTEADPALKKQLVDGVKKLDAIFSVPFLELSEGNQLKAVEAIQGAPMFSTVRGHTVVGLYNNPLVWRHFGYEGPSFPLGGYTDRGFNDINWLPKG